MNVLERIGNIGIVPVVVIEDAQHVLPTADALIKGGIGVMEITLRTKAGLASIEKAAAERPDMLVGAGTVLTLEQCKVCVQAGAKFIVSPGFDYNMVNGASITASRLRRAASPPRRSCRPFPSGWTCSNSSPLMFTAA